MSACETRLETYWTWAAARKAVAQQVARQPDSGVTAWRCAKCGLFHVGRRHSRKPCRRQME